LRIVLALGIDCHAFGASHDTSSGPALGAEAGDGEVDGVVTAWLVEDDDEAGVSTIERSGSGVVFEQATKQSAPRPSMRPRPVEIP